MNILEIFAFVSGFVAIFLSIWQNAWTWPISIASNTLFVGLFWQQARSPDVGFRLLFILFAVYGWYAWTRRRNGKILRTSGITLQSSLLLGIIGLVGVMGIWILLRSTGFQAPLFDILAVVLAVLAEYMLAKKYLEAWYALLISDLLLVSVYFNWQLYFLSFLSLLTFIMCVIGLQRWKKLIINQE